MWQEVSPMRSKRRRMFSPLRAAVAAPGGILIAVCMFTVVVPRVATVAAQSAQEGLAPQEQKRARPLVVGTGSKTFREGLIPSPIPPLPGKNAGTVIPDVNICSLLSVVWRRLDSYCAQTFDSKRHLMHMGELRREQM